MTGKSESFGKLFRGAINAIAGFEAKTVQLIEEEIGQQINIGHAAVRRYKTGFLPPEHETIEILAELCMKRGRFSREWLQSFLKAARYPQAEKLVTKLLGEKSNNSGTANPTRRVYQNLPPPTYSQFIMRDEAYQGILDGLAQRTAVVLISSLGGMGKTSLAREVAARCLTNQPSFEAVVWISDKDRPGTTNLDIVLDEIALIMDFPGFTRLEHTTKQREVEQLLRQKKVLLVVDNFETITDRVLLNWLIKLPEPSKAIITTRHYRQEFRSCWPVELGGMSEDEANLLITERLRVLKLEKLVSSLQIFRPLVLATGGNPKAISLALGCIKYNKKSLEEVLTELLESQGELFEDLFKHSWALLDESARNVLMGLTFFAASSDKKAIDAATEVRGSYLEDALEQLIDLSLVDVQQEDLKRPPRYLLHPLVQTYAHTRLIEMPVLEARIRINLINYFINLSQNLNQLHSAIEELARFDADQETVYQLIAQAFKHQLYPQVISLVTGYNYYYYVYAHWGKMLENLAYQSQAAQIIDDKESLVRARAKYVQMLIKQGNLAKVEASLAELKEYEGIAELSTRARIEVQHTLALFALEHGQVGEAINYWQKTLANDLTDLDWENATGQRWLGNCLYKLNQLDEAQLQLVAAQKLAKKFNFTRIVIATQILLAEIALNQHKLAEAQDYLETSLTQAYHYNDHRNIGRIHYNLASLQKTANQTKEARINFEKAIDHFQRVGMQRELAAAQENLLILE